MAICLSACGFALAAAAVLAAIVFFWAVPSGSKQEVADSTHTPANRGVQPESVSPASYRADSKDYRRRQRKK